jgi:hypothetical protein
LSCFQFPVAIEQMIDITRRAHSQALRNPFHHHHRLAPHARTRFHGLRYGKAAEDCTHQKLAPLGDRDGTFHNFGSYEFIVRAYPPDPERRPIAKVYKTGALMAPDDRIPERIYFDFGPKPPNRP